ncbi:hypothetical protein Tco_0551008 [Tanacetum coccineum]
MTFGVATLRAVVHAGDKTSGDARSCACHAALAVLHDALRALVDMLLVAMLTEDVFGSYVVALHEDLRRLQTQLVDIDTESDPEEAPSETEESQPLARIAEATTLSPSSFWKRYRSSYEIPPPSLSLTHPVQKRYRGTSELILDTDSEGDKFGEEDTKEDERSDADDERERESGLEDEGPGMEEEEAAPEGQQQAVLVVDTATSEPLGLGYGAARCRAPESTKEIAPSTYEVDPEDGWVYTDILTYAPPAAPVQTPPSPEDLRELYTRSGAVRDEIFSQRYRFRSLEREQERATVTFSAIWRPNQDLRRQPAEERRERLELTDSVARMESRHEFGGK